MLCGDGYNDVIIGSLLILEELCSHKESVNHSMKFPLAHRSSLNSPSAPNNIFRGLDG